MSDLVVMLAVRTFDDELPFGIACELIEPAMFDHRVLSQDQVWVDKFAVVYRLDETFPLDLLGWLAHAKLTLRAVVLWANYVEIGCAVEIGVEAPPEEDPAVDALKWPHSRPLWRRLVQLADAVVGSAN